MCCWLSPQLNLTAVKAATPPGEEPDWGRWMAGIEKGAGAGREAGLGLVLDTQAWDYSEAGPVGVAVDVIHHLDSPDLSVTGVVAGPGTLTQLGVTASLQATTLRALQR